MEPKKILIEFLKFWKLRNKKQMFARCTETWQHHHNKNDFEATGLKSFEVGEPKINETICDFSVKLNGESHEVRLVCEAEAGKGDINGNWGVYPGSFRAVK